MNEEQILLMIEHLDEKWLALRKKQFGEPEPDHRAERELFDEYRALAANFRIYLHTLRPQ